VPPGQLDPLTRAAQLRPLPLQVWQGPGQLASLQLPAQLPPWHIAWLPVQLAAEQLGTQVPLLQLPSGQPVPATAFTQVSATHTLQGPGQLPAVHLGGSAI
jgi:hypothetical protein